MCGAREKSRKRGRGKGENLLILRQRVYNVSLANGDGQWSSNRGTKDDPGGPNPFCGGENIHIHGFTWKWVGFRISMDSMDQLAPLRRFSNFHGVGRGGASQVPQPNRFSSEAGQGLFFAGQPIFLRGGAHIPEPVTICCYFFLTKPNT